MITPSKQANRKKTEENINQPSIKTIPSAITYMQQIKILFSTDELSIKFKPLNCYGASRLRGVKGDSVPPYEHRTLYVMRKHYVYTGGMLAL